MSVYYPPQTIALKHRIAKPVRVSTSSPTPANNSPILFLLAKIVLQVLWVLVLIAYRVLRAMVRFARCFSIVVNEGVFLLTFNEVVFFGVDLCGNYSDSPIVIESPFGYGSK